MYESNYQILSRVCREKRVIRPVCRHRNPDGSLDIDGNLKIWNDAIALFEQLPLWEEGAPGFDDRDSRQSQPSMIFVPAQNCNEKTGTVIVAHGSGFEGTEEIPAHPGAAGHHHPGDAVVQSGAGSTVTTGIQHSTQ